MGGLEVYQEYKELLQEVQAAVKILSLLKVIGLRWLIYPPRKQEGGTEIISILRIFHPINRIELDSK